ncbi:type II toxin-antitoxin system RelE/ParE family toxin [Candidatus Pacearchaeota archaeon]|nr:type II toxin-antitoxin system RelE/ParE family toxin [Candidatus Pacearchaeota archaeon]HLC73306.1 type II toxin-antitoxin system RelE/ParE family toxin [Candidatus Nanoarchaeia archaeon]
MYEIILSEEARGQLKKLDKKTKDRIGSALDRIKIRPHNFVKKLYNSKYYRTRVDNYRIILDIRDVHLIIYVIEVGNREKIYKN